MITFTNLLPKQTAPIPWGWENKTIADPLCGTATYVSAPLGRVAMPDLISPYDWTTFILEGTTPLLGTRNMKSVFTTAARFLGYEKLLVEQPDLTAITSGFYAWNKMLLDVVGFRLSYFMLGDDVAGNMGLLMSSKDFLRWIWPEQQRLLTLAKRHGLTTIYHSDGDIAEIMPDLLASSLIDVINYEPVGRMNIFLGKHEAYGKLLEVAHDQAQQHANSMALQRSNA